MNDYRYVKLMLLVLFALMAKSSAAQQKMDDLMERTLVLRCWGKEGVKNDNGKMKTYGLGNGEWLLFHKNGILEWNKEKEHKHVKCKYVVRNDTVLIPTYKDFWMKFFVPQENRGGVNDDGYIVFKDSRRQHFFCKLSEADNYSLYVDCMNAKRYDAAFDYLFAAAKDDSPLMLCALGYHYENNIGIKAADNGLVSYLLAEYQLTVSKKEQAAKIKEGREMLMQMGLLPASILDAPFEEENSIELTAEQKKIILAYVRRKSGLMTMPEKGDEYYDENLTSAMEYLDKAVQTNQDATAMFMLGRIYYEGLQGFADKTLGLDYLNRAADKNNIAALGYLAGIFAKSGQKAKARQYWERAARQTICQPVFTVDQVATLADPNNDERCNIEYYQLARKKAK